MEHHLGGKRPIMLGISWIKSYARTAQLVAYLLADLILSILFMGVALLLSALIDTVSASLASGDLSPVVSLTLFSIAYSLGLGIMSLAAGMIRASIVRDVMVGLRGAGARGMMARTGAGARDSAEQLTVLGQNMETLEHDWLIGTLDVVDSLFQIAIGVALLVWLNPLIACVSLVGMALPTVLPRLFAGRLSHAQGLVIRGTKSYNGCVRDAAQGREVLWSFRAERPMTDKIDRQARLLQGHKARLARTMACVSGMASATGTIMQFAIMGLTGVFAVWGLVSIGSVIAVTQLSGSVIAPASELSGKLGKIRACSPLLKSMGELEQVAREHPQAVRCGITQSLALDNVSFSYGSGERTVISGCSMRFEAGRKYVIIGQSGCGKSTMLGLLSGRLTPSSGTVLVDGKGGTAPDAAFIHQNVFLFDDSLRENICLGASFPDERVDKAVRLAGLEGVMSALPEGLDTPIQENGSRLSGGERQRVAIARALLHGKRLLLVDEATSALDRATAAQIEDVLLSLKGVTVIAVTHHLDGSHARRYDAVLSLQSGRLQVCGPSDLPSCTRP